MQPPDNPLSNSGFPDPNTPLPATNTNTNTSPFRPPVITFDVITDAWNMLKPNLGTYMGASLVVGLIVLVLEGLLFASMTRDATGQPQMGVLSSIVYVAIYVVMTFLYGGLIRLALNHIKTGKPAFGDLFSASDVVVQLILSVILMSLGLTVGICLCVIPYFLLLGLFMFVFPLIIDKRMGAVEAITLSFNTLKSQMWMAILFLIVVTILSSLGSLACGIGALVTAPWALLSFALTYHNFFGGGQIISNTQTLPVAPIADPRF